MGWFNVGLAVFAGAHTQLDALQGSGMVAAAAAGQLKLMQVGLSASNPPLQALAMHALQQQQQQQQAGRSEIWAVWRTSPKLFNSSSSSSWPQQQHHHHAAVDCREGYEKGAAAVLRSINGRSGMLATAAVGAVEDDGDDGNDYVIGALPLLSLSGSKQLWPEDHMVSCMMCVTPLNQVNQVNAMACGAMPPAGSAHDPVPRPAHTNPWCYPI